MKLLLDDGNEHVGDDSAPDLRLHRVLAGAQETPDVNVLLDPLEEQFDLPAAFVQRGVRQGGQADVVGPEDPCLSRLGVLEADSPQMLRVMLRRLEAVEHDALVADHVAGAVGGGRVHPSRIHACLGAGDQEGASRVHRIQALEVHIASIHHVKSPGLRGMDPRHEFQATTEGGHCSIGG